jgi:uncharacterized surface protein with fasciclin (FAS1) repeats
MKVKLFAAAVLTLALGYTAAADEKKTIAENVAASKDHTILLALVTEAGLADALGGKGPLTVFGPTDEAFKKLPKETLEKVKGDKELLKKILMAHVVSGKAVMASDVMKMDGKDVNGFKITAKDKDVMVGPAKVTKADIKASNGVIHVIDTVLVPGK